MKTGGNSASAQPIAANGNIYWADWNGNEHATTTSGTDAWATNLGTTGPAACVSYKLGVASTATAAVLGSTPVIYVGGGNATFYALNALTGAILWQTNLGTQPDHVIWSSPTLYNNSIYIGISSYGDCPVVAGQLFELNAATGAIENVATVVPPGCIGAGITSSPTVDASDGSIYVDTGNGDPGCSEPLAFAMVKLRASDLSVESSWQVPSAQQVSDSDFLATPTLFTATIAGQTRSLVGAANKNGTFYAFDRTNLAGGPVWETTIAVGGPGPYGTGGQGSIVPAAFDGTNLYVGSGQATINGTTCVGSLEALDPATGAFRWRNCLNGIVLGAVTAVPGVLVVGADNNLLVVDSGTGATLFSYTLPQITFAPATVSNGIVYVPDSDGNLYAFGQ